MRRAALLAPPLAGACFVVMLWCAPAWGAGVSFAPRAVYPVGGYPTSVAVADFNGDGDADLAVANEGLSSVQVLLGGPDGAFGTATGYRAGSDPETVAVGDFNGDSDPDVVVGYLNASHVSVMLGGPGGTLGAETRYSVGYNHGSVAVGDFNGDGDPDLVTANLDSGTVSVLLGGPGGTFGAETRYPVEPHPDTVAVGDFNRDGDPDLALVGESAGSVSVLLGGPGGTFGGHASYTVGSYPWAVAVGDFNADDDPDLAVANTQSDDVSVLLGGAAGAFAAQSRYRDDGNPVSVVVGDFNRDGDSDLATANYGANSVAVLLGGPGGTFGAPSTYAVGNWPRSVAVGDLNLDGNPDLAVANTLSGSLSVLLNTTGVSLDPIDVAFSATVVGQASPTRKVTLSNHGPAGVAVSGVGLAGGDADSFAISEDACSGATVPSAGSCSVKVRFRPLRAGSHSARLEFTDSAPGSPQAVALSGTGISPVALAPASVPFQAHPDHTSSGRKTVTLTNVAVADLTVNGVAVTGTDASSFLAGTDTCTGATLTTGQSCTAQVRFRPLGTGAKTAALRFSDSAIDSPQAVPLSGTGTPGAWLERSAQALKFGHVRVGTTAPTETVTLTNIGSAAMTIADIAKEGTNPTDFRNLTQTCTASGTLNPGQSCTATIAFRPTATGTRAATLTITDTAPHNPHHVQLYGTGT